MNWSQCSCGRPMPQGVKCSHGRQPGPCEDPACLCRCTWARGGSCPACLHPVFPTEVQEDTQEDR